MAAKLGKGMVKIKDEDGKVFVVVQSAFDNYWSRHGCVEAGEDDELSPREGGAEDAGDAATDDGDTARAGRKAAAKKPAKKAAKKAPAKKAAVTPTGDSDPQGEQPSGDEPSDQ